MVTSEPAEEIIHGHCKCGRAVVKVLHSRVPTLWLDGTRYAYPADIDTDIYCIFRCRGCHEPISETFSADSPVHNTPVTTTL